MSVWVLAPTLVGACLSGCSSSPSPASTEPNPFVGPATTGPASGDWDDARAAAAAAVPAVELAIVHVEEPTPDRLIFELLSARDEPGELVIERRPGSGELDVRARVGRFGDPRRERALVEAVRRRLGQLRGVDVAPLE